MSCRDSRSAVDRTQVTSIPDHEPSCCARFDRAGDLELDDLVANHASWPVQQRLQAELPLTTRCRRTVRHDMHADQEPALRQLRTTL
jgi:hypothetical protein